MAIPSTETEYFLNLAPGKQQRILEAAIHEFAERGYESASMNTVVKSAGISKGALFKYFRSKTGLFAFVYRMALDQVKAYLRTVRDNSREENFFVRLEKIMRAGVEFIQCRPGLARIYYRIVYTGDAPEKQKLLKDIRGESLKFIQSLVQQAMDRNELRPDLDPTVCAFVLECILDRFIQVHHLEFMDPTLKLCGASADTSDQWIRQIVHMIRIGLQPISSQTRKESS